MSDLDRLEAAIGECREMIREAHAATKDLRTAVREAKKELRELTKDEVAGQVHSEITRQLDEVRERTSEAVTAATQKVIAEFDRFGESLLGKETYWKTASGRRSARRPENDVVELEVSKDVEHGAGEQHQPAQHALPSDTPLAWAAPGPRPWVPEPTHGV